MLLRPDRHGMPQRTAVTAAAVCGQHPEVLGEQDGMAQRVGHGAQRADRPDDVLASESDQDRAVNLTALPASVQEPEPGGVQLLREAGETGAQRCRTAIELGHPTGSRSRCSRPGAAAARRRSR